MNALETIQTIFEFLCLVKDFEPGYASDAARDGYLLIEHKGKRYAIKLTEIAKDETPEMNLWNEAEAIAVGNLYLTLQLAKGLDVLCTGCSFREGCLLLDHAGKRYNLNLSEINHPSENIFDDIKKLQYLV